MFQGKLQHLSTSDSGAVQCIPVAIAAHSIFPSISCDRHAAYSVDSESGTLLCADILPRSVAMDAQSLGMSFAWALATLDT